MPTQKTEEKQPKKTEPEVQSEKELILIQELIKTRLETNRGLAYESFDGYELPPSSQFSMLKKPAVTIRYGKFTFNMAAIRLFEGVVDILPIVNSKTKRLAAVPCAEEEDGSVEWARQRKKDDAWVNKDITSIDFCENIYEMMGWNRECRYKVVGNLRNSDRGLILVFELEEAIMFEPKKQEYIDPTTGEVKQRQVKYYPDFYKDRIGKSYNDYAAARQLSMFEDTETYADMAHTATERDKKTDEVGKAEPGGEETVPIQPMEGDALDTNPEKTDISEDQSLIDPGEQGTFDNATSSGV